MRRLSILLVMMAVFFAAAAEAANFVDNGNGTVTDNKTGLMWQQGESGFMTWQAALDHCENLELPSGSGQRDWRLPNIKELESITDDMIYDPDNPIAIDSNFFPNAYASYYWSSTTYTYHPSDAWDVNFNFNNGFVNYYDKGNNSRYVRCVRGGKGDVCESKTICTILGNDPKPYRLDQDIFKFSGTKGEKVTIRLEADPPEAGAGKRASLILTDNIKRTVLWKSDRSDLPNEITAKLPATGEYLITVAEQLLKPKKYSGQYCLTLKALPATYQTFAPTFSVE